jgi:hypothetical protein
MEQAAQYAVVVIAGSPGAALSCRGDGGACRFVVQVVINLGAAFVQIREEDGFLVLAEAGLVFGRTLGQEEASAGGDLEGLLRHLVAIAVGHESEIDAGAPDGLTVGIADQLADAEGGFKGIGRQRGLPV